MTHEALQLLVERSLRELGYEIVGDDEDGWSYAFGSFESSRNTGQLDTIEEATAAAFRDAVAGFQDVVAAGISVVDHWETHLPAEFDATHVTRVQAVNRYALLEGWAIFNQREIQRDDALGRFESDDDALAHVRRLAKAGSRLHCEALALLRLPL